MVKFSHCKSIQINFFLNFQLLYLCFGTHQVVLPDCVGLETKVDLYLDDVKIDLPELQAIVCINIDSWGAGVHLWRKFSVYFAACFAVPK